MLRLVAESVYNGFFWGLGLTALVWCLQAMTRRANAGTRHAVWCFTLAAVVLLPVLSVAVRWPASSETAGGETVVDDKAAAGLFVVWAWGALFMLARLIVSAVRLRRLVRAAEPLPSIFGVPVYSSAAIASPMAAGVSAPVILLPEGLESRLTETELQHVVLHETAHIRRSDSWINFGQRLVEALYFFHPAVWWIGRQLRFECEIACDDWVVAATGKPRSYAASLTRLVEITVLRRAPVLATAAVTGKRQISRRIELLLERRGNRNPRPSAFGISAAAVLIGAAVLCCAYAPSIFAFSGSQMDEQVSMSISRSNFCSSFTLKSRGLVEFADNDRDVKRISAGGWLTVEVREGLTWRKLSFTPHAGGVDRVFRVNGVAEPFEPAGRQWMESLLPGMVRETGIGAAARVSRLMGQGGADRVLAEISRIDSQRARRIYYQELMSRTTDYEMLRPILRLAMHDILSDGDRRRLLVTLLDRPPLLADLLQVASRFDSDGDKAGFLVEALRRYPENEAGRVQLFKTLNTISSDHERRRVLGEMLRRPIAREVAPRVFDAAAKLSSDSVKTQVLTQGVPEISASLSARRAWFNAVDTLHSDNEHRRALEAVLRGDGRDREMLLTIIRSASWISSDNEKAAILSQVARVCPDDDTVVEALVDSAQALHSDGEYRRVITPLVRKGRGLRVIQKI